MDLASKKVIMIIAPENFRDEEYFHAREALEKRGVKVEVASTAKIAISGIEHKEVEVDKLVSEVDDSYDAIAFVGGGGARVYFENEKVLTLAKNYYENGKIVAAICIAPLILGHAGIMHDKKATCWESHQAELEDFGAHFTGELVTVDGKIITGNGPKAAYDFGNAIADAL
jgi:protease I